MDAIRSTAEEERLETAFRFLREKTSFRPKTVLVLGSGLNGFADLLEPECVIPFGEVPGLPAATVPGHEGKFLFGNLEGVPLAVMQGRLHYYEGNTPATIVLPLRILRKTGAENLILTNAAGGIQKGMVPGDLMLIEDHISFLIPSPLRGPNCDTLGPRFPDMSEVYDKKLRDLVLECAASEQIPVKRGVYVQTPGPAFETPAEIRMLRTLGADAVGMSTAIEAQAARHCGMRVCGISCISNLACGISEKPLSISDIAGVSGLVSGKLERLLVSVIRKLS